MGYTDLARMPMDVTHVRILPSDDATEVDDAELSVRIGTCPTSA